MREVAIIGCRVFALYWFISALMILSYALLAAIDLFVTPGADTSAAAQTFVINMAFPQFIIYLLAASVLWFKAQWLAKLMLPVPSQDINIEASNLRAIQTLIFSGIGIYLVLSTIPALAAHLYKGALTAQELKLPLAHSLSDKLMAIQLWLQLALGLGLFVGARPLANFLMWLRYLGSKFKD